MSLDYKWASEFQMLFGKYKGQTLDEISSSDEGLKYLDWLRGERHGQSLHIDLALRLYLDDPAIKRELENL